MKAEVFLFYTFLVAVSSIAPHPWSGSPFAWGTLPTGNVNSAVWNDGIKDEKIGETAGTRAGTNTLRIAYPEHFAIQWGYGIRSGTVDKYFTFGHSNLVSFMNGPKLDHSLCDSIKGGCQLWETDHYPPMNLYERIWDAADPNKPNANNFWATHMFNMATEFKGRIKVYEIWNEPDFLAGGVPWEVTQKGLNNNDNWYSRDPKAAELSGWHGSIQMYNRLMHVSFAVVKKVDPDAYIATGGLGYAGFLDAMLRNTEKENGVTYPANSDVDGTTLGGEFFDMLSFHYYPALSSKQANNEWNSDYWAKELVTLKNEFLTVLNVYGYGGARPAKEFIVTETGISNPAVNGAGGEDVRKNYWIKAGIQAHINQIRQLHVFTALNGDGVSDLGTMGLFFAQTGSQTPQEVPMKEDTKAIFTFQRVMRISDKTYDAAASASLKAAIGVASVQCHVFVGGPTPNEKVSIVWVSTEGSKDENVAGVTVQFPSNNAQVTTANYANVRSVVTVSGGKVSLALTSFPTFVVEDATGGGNIRPTTTTQPQQPAPTTTTVAQQPVPTTTTVPANNGGGTPTTTVPANNGGGTPTTTVPANNGGGGVVTTTPVNNGGGIPTTTTVKDSSSPTSTTTTSPSSSVPGSCVAPDTAKTACERLCCTSDLPSGRRRLQIKLKAGSFDCTTWMQDFSVARNVPISSVRVCSLSVDGGSSVIGMELPESDSAKLKSDFSNVPSIFSVIDQPTSSGPNVGLIVGVTLGAVILVALVIAAIVYFVHRSRKFHPEAEMSQIAYHHLGQ